MEEGASAFKNLTDKTIGKRPLGKRRHRLEGNIKICLKEIGVSTRSQIDSVQDGEGLLENSCEFGIERTVPICHGLLAVRKYYLNNNNDNNNEGH